MAFEKGTIVLLEGLKSEAGQKLNGGQGVIIQTKPIQSEGDRYAVRIYATLDQDKGGELEILEETIDKKLKPDNLKIAKKEDNAKLVFYKAAKAQINKLQETEMKACLFWLDVYHKNVPKDYVMGLAYANYVMAVEGNHKEAADIYWKFLHENPPEGMTENAEYPRYLHDGVTHFCSVREHLEEALEFALLIPKDTPEHLTFWRSALQTIQNTTMSITSETRGLGPTVDQYINVRLRATTHLVAQFPDDDTILQMVASAHCLAGNNYEGVKWYRRLLARNPPNYPEVKQGLIMAQLACPGMPLDNMHVLGMDATNGIVCIRNEDKPNAKVNAGGGVVSNGNGPLTIHTHTGVYTDPEAAIFAPLLERLRQENAL